ncbi:unnamed protein product [Spirodela intermedia]|uniref:Uncharacterized protein n=1 Tax=Spirodela intermedia TaxID=51605 RepID=A0A7I8JNP4_SPIIN|nr:unnamed protein product [Spirodela intermedia]CAA6671794.1 unnamed protein product [Spirodela intermedia]
MNFTAKGCQIKHVIELLFRKQPQAKAPYKMLSTYLEELKKQLK